MKKKKILLIVIVSILAILILWTSYFKILAPEPVQGDFPIDPNPPYLVAINNLKNIDSGMIIEADKWKNVDSAFNLSTPFNGDSRMIVHLD